MGIPDRIIIWLFRAAAVAALVGAAVSLSIVLLKAIGL